MTTLTISKQTDGAEIEIGKLVFDASNNATLTTEGSGPDVEQLKRVWAEASQLKSLPMEWTEKTKVDGSLKTTRKSKDVAKGDEEYPAAVWSYLESTHGYLVDKE